LINFSPRGKDWQGRKARNSDANISQETRRRNPQLLWLHDLLKLHVHHIVVCDPRKNELLQEGSKSDRIDAPKLTSCLPTIHPELSDLLRVCPT
jgi:hypothetical protein